MIHLTLIIRPALWLLGMACLCSATQAATDTLRSLKIHVLTSYGKQLKYDLVGFRSDNPDRDALSHCRALVCTRLRFGVYHYKLVRPDTNDVLEGKILVLEPQQVLTVDAGPGGGGASRDTEGFTVEGSVKVPNGGAHPDRVRLQSLFAEWNLEVSVSPSGQFVMEYVPPGMSLLVLLRGGVVVHTQLISTSEARTNRVWVDVTLGPEPIVTQGHSMERSK